METKQECISSYYGTRYVICPNCNTRAGYHVYFDSQAKKSFRCKCNKTLTEIKNDKLFGQLQIIKKNSKNYIRCITTIGHEETTDIFEVISSPCVYCGGITKNCTLCKGSDQVWVLKK